MEYSEVADFIRKNWVPLRPRESRRWISGDDLRDSSPETLQTLLLLYAESVLSIPGVELTPNFTTPLANGILKVSGHSIDLEELAKFLRALTLAEYRLDSLLYYPHKIRASSIQNYASELGWPSDLLWKVHLWWHDSNRSRVMTEE